MESCRAAELQSTSVLYSSPHTGSNSVPPCTPSHVSVADEHLNRAFMPLAKRYSPHSCGDGSDRNQPGKWNPDLMTYDFSIREAVPGDAPDFASSQVLAWRAAYAGILRERRHRRRDL